MLGIFVLHLGVFLLYVIAASTAAFLLPAAYALPLVLLVFLAAVRGYAIPLRGAAAAERAAVVRLAPIPAAALPWLAAAAPAMLILSWSLGEVYVGLVPVPERVLDPFAGLDLGAERLLVVTILAVALAPIVEEIFFRGLIQHPLERRIGVGAGIALASLLFALVHVETLPWLIPLHAALGAIFGFAVYATRSIWAGVALHAVNNAAAMVGLAVEAHDPRPTVWERGVDAEWLAGVGALLLSLAVGIWIARRLWDSVGR